MHLNFEFKARHPDISKAEEILLQQNPVFIGEDHQTDTYFNVPHGRLKLREGNIENALIFYDRTDTAAAKQSKVILYKHKQDAALKTILTTSLGIKIVIDKKRRIYFIDNVKFHFDEVSDLGSFIEVEAIDSEGKLGIEKIKNQCLFFQQLLGVKEEDFIDVSYSDMMMAKKSSFTIDEPKS